jgi:hypothetical protein
LAEILNKKDVLIIDDFAGDDRASRLVHQRVDLRLQVKWLGWEGLPRNIVCQIVRNIFIK